MRLSIVILMTMLFIGTKAQSIRQNQWMPGLYNNTLIHPVPSFDSASRSKWSFSKYAGISVGYSFFKGGSASSVSVPLGVQLNRRLTNNIYAFAGVMAAPSYINFNSTFIPTDNSKTNGSFFTKGNNLGLYSRAELGIMYVNDARTFSISGSIGVERNSTPVYYSAPVMSKQNPVFLPN